MSAFAATNQDRPLELSDLLRELVAQGRVDQDSAEQCLAIHGSPSTARPAGSGPARARMSGSIEGLSRDKCRTTKTAAGRFFGSARATLRSASTPPAEAPMTITRKCEEFVLDMLWLGGGGRVPAPASRPAAVRRVRLPAPAC